MTFIIEKNEFSDSFIKDCATKKVVIFGAGNNAENLVVNLGHLFMDGSFLVDNNKSLWGAKRFGFTIKSPDCLKNVKNDEYAIVIASDSYSSIFFQLISMGVTYCYFYRGKAFFANPFLENIADFRRLLLRIETTSRCNFKCTFCAHAKMKRPQVDMTDELYKKIIDEACSLGIRRLDARGFGEPLLDKKIVARVAYAKDKGFSFIEIFTNAYLLTNESYQRLSEAGLTQIIVSFAPKVEFERTRPGIMYDSVFDNLKKLRLRENTHVKVHLVAPSSSNNEIEETIFQLNRIGFEGVIRAHIHNWAADETSTNDCACYIPCFRVFRDVNILVDGRVSLCCLDIKPDIVLGNLAEDSLANILNRPEYEQARKDQLNQNPPQICLRCTNFK